MVGNSTYSFRWIEPLGCRRIIRTAQQRGRRNWLKRKYGLSERDYKRLLAETGGVCAICHQPETEKRLGKPRTLCVDHDHTTGLVRGLLCSACNRAIGLLGDNAQRARAAVAYLERTTP